MIPSLAGQPQPKMSGDVRISGQFGAPATNSHQVGQPAKTSSTVLTQNRPGVMQEQTLLPHLQPANSFDPAFVITHSGRVGSTIQQNAAAAFFAKKNPSRVTTGTGQLGVGRSRERAMEDSEEERPGKARLETNFNFSTILAKCPPPPPPALIKKISEAKDSSGVGKVKVILRVANSGVIDDKKSSFFKMDKKKKQVTLLAPDNQREHCELEEAESEPRRSLDVSAPKMFAFDGLYTDEDGQTELSGSSLCDLLCSVVNGTDGTLFCFGHANLGKSYTMIGSDESSRTIGLIPTAISWLFKSIKEKKEKSGARFSVRVSACEIRGGQEEMRDLLLQTQTEQDPGPGLRLGGVSIQSLCEVRAGTAEKAGYYLDCALTNRSVDSQGRDSHFIFTLHLYQHSVTTDSSAAVLLGGRSRLHLIDFGWCERTKTLGGSITQAGLGNVILGILNGQRHLPFKESKVTGLLREVLGSVSCQAALLAHISPEPSHYSETLHTIQLASRIHRMRRKKMKLGGSSGGGSGSGGSSDENKRLGRLHGRDSGKSSSDMTTSTDPSSSEQSCDTVIYVGPRDDEGTDCESPPVFLPSLNSGDQRAVMSRVLKGSSAELPPAKYRSLDRKCQRSPGLLVPCRSPSSSQHSTPVKTLSLASCKSPQSTGSLPRTPRGKMPLHGKVAGYRQPAGTELSHLPHNQRLSLAGSSGRSRLSDSNNQPPEVWVDSKPSCDRDLVPGQYDTNAIYGYMDEHKKQMIQQWVEGQAISLHSAPPSHLTGLESLAWLQAQSEQTQYKCLTQFKMAESSTSECSEQEPSRCDDDDERPPSNDPRYPADQEMKTKLRETLTDCQSEVKVGQDKIAEPLKPTSGAEIALQSNEVKETSQTCQHERENKCVEEGETRKTLSPSKQAEKQNLNLYLADNRSIASKSSTNSSRKSDVGTNTDITPSSVNIPFNTKHQDPYGSSRKLTLRRTSELAVAQQNPVDEMSGIRTLDELYSHCEQLVETLSQASEDLRAQSESQCHNDKVELGGTKTQEYLRIHQSDSNGMDDIEIYEVSEGSEASVEVSDIGCQATEEDIALCLVSDPPCSGSEQHLARILSQTCETAVHGPEVSPLSSEQERTERTDIEMQVRRYKMIRHKQAAGDGGGGEPPNKSQDVDMADFENVCEEVSNFADHEEFFNKKFDQLEKLHELYKSVSSISAASQSRLELNKNRQYENRNLLGQRSASFSLTGLMLGDLDNLSLPSTVSDDLNSLCSEPAWISRQTNFLDINRNSTSCTNSTLDILDRSNLSLSDLIHTGPSLRLDKTNVKIESNPAGERSDSPILEGIDSDLAKYAKLKDLEQAYKPKYDNQDCDKTERRQLGSLRHPDGASDPDLRSVSADRSPGPSLPPGLPPRDLLTTFPRPAATLPRRSPGTGRSSSGSDPEEMSVANRTKTVKTNSRDRESDRGHPAASPSLHLQQQNGNIKPDKTDSESDLNIKDQKEKIAKIPRFSRLFSNVKKISRSPSLISKGSDEKTRSKASKRQTKTSSQISLKESGQFKTEKLINDKPTKTKYRFFEKREKCLPKSPVNVTKNVKGTLSSEQLFEKPKTTKAKNSPIVQKSDKKDKKSIKTKNAGVCAVSCLPSPYSYPSKIKTKKNVNSETSGSGYDSGIDSGIVSGLRSSSLVKIRGREGKGADTMIIGNPSSSSGVTLQRRSSRSHCKSSGYESFGLDSESTSVESYHGTLSSGSGPEVPILQYDETKISRLDRHWRFEEIKRLKKRQEELKGELFSAKTRIGSDPEHWSYELHTESSGLDPTDPNFVEAFEAETVILDKRVQACKSHVEVTTCFDNRSQVPAVPREHVESDLSASEQV